jgi:YidC/Oxa1 family membrane protein insertase
VFDALADVILKILHYLFALTGSYGLAVVLLAVLMKLVLYYPTHQQLKAMKDMQRLQPEVEKLQKKYKDDPERLQKETMELYRVHKVNPLGGCLPMLLQMPILVAIWQAIMRDQQVFSSAYFLWIHPGPLQAKFPGLLASNLAGRDFPLILFYGLTMYLSQRLTPAAGAQAASQRTMALGMTIFFTWLMWSYNWPCALILYWSVFSLLSIVQQAILMRTPDAVARPAT